MRRDHLTHCCAGSNCPRHRDCLRILDIEPRNFLAPLSFPTSFAALSAVFSLLPSVNVIRIPCSPVDTRAENPSTRLRNFASEILSHRDIPVLRIVNVRCTWKLIFMGQPSWKNQNVWQYEKKVRASFFFVPEQQCKSAEPRSFLIRLLRVFYSTPFR